MLFLCLQLFLKYTSKALETCNTVQTCIGYVYKGNGTLIKIVLLNYVPFVEWSYVRMFTFYHRSSDLIYKSTLI